MAAPAQWIDRHVAHSDRADRLTCGQPQPCGQVDLSLVIPGTSQSYSGSKSGDSRLHLWGLASREHSVASPQPPVLSALGQNGHRISHRWEAEGSQGRPSKSGSDLESGGSFPKASVMAPFMALPCQTPPPPWEGGPPTVPGTGWTLQMCVC